MVEATFSRPVLARAGDADGADIAAAVHGGGQVAEDMFDPHADARTRGIRSFLLQRQRLVATPNWSKPAGPEP